MASTAFRASTWTPTYADVGALSSSTFIPSVYGDVGAASAAHSHTYSDVGAASAGHNHDGRYYSANDNAVFTSVSTTTLNLYGDVIHKMYQHNIRVGAESSVSGNIMLFDSNSASYTTATLIAAIKAAGYSTSNTGLMYVGNITSGYRGAFCFVSTNNYLYFYGYSSRNSATGYKSVNSLTSCVDNVREMFQEINYDFRRIKN